MVNKITGNHCETRTFNPYAIRARRVVGQINHILAESCQDPVVQQANSEVMHLRNTQLKVLVGINNLQKFREDMKVALN